jgi:hypothetical protein
VTITLLTGLARPFNGGRYQGSYQLPRARLTWQSPAALAEPHGQELL